MTLSFKTGYWRKVLRNFVVVICCFTPLLSFSNPVTLDPVSLFGFASVAFWALVVESGIVALLLAFRGIHPVRCFLIYFLINGAVFLFLFNPLLERGWPVPVLELLVVLVDGLAIKTLARFEFLQWAGFRGVSWLNALIVSLIGNASSFFVGLIASQKPWEVE